MMSNNIAGKVVVITGAISGLGEASARPDLQGKSPCAQLSCSAPATFVSRPFPTPALSSRPTRSSSSDCNSGVRRKAFHYSSLHRGDHK
jgi:hypothetical protein